MIYMFKWHFVAPNVERSTSVAHAVAVREFARSAKSIGQSPPNCTGIVRRYEDRWFNRCGASSKHIGHVGRPYRCFTQGKKSVKFDYGLVVAPALETWNETIKMAVARRLAAVLAMNTTYEELLCNDNKEESAEKVDEFPILADTLKTRIAVIKALASKTSLAEARASMKSNPVSNWSCAKSLGDFEDITDRLKACESVDAVKSTKASAQELKKIFLDMVKDCEAAATGMKNVMKRRQKRAEAKAVPKQSAKGRAAQTAVAVEGSGACITSIVGPGQPSHASVSASRCTSNTLTIGFGAT